MSQTIRRGFLLLFLCQCIYIEHISTESRRLKVFFLPGLFCGNNSVYFSPKSAVAFFKDLKTAQHFPDFYILYSNYEYVLEFFKHTFVHQTLVIRKILTSNDK